MESVRCALITGAGSPGGIGFAAAKQLGLDGARVVLTSTTAQLGEIVKRVRDGRLLTNIGIVAAVDDAVAALNPTERRLGKTVIAIRG